jgi:hypothetical protein
MHGKLLRTADPGMRNETFWLCQNWNYSFSRSRGMNNDWRKVPTILTLQPRVNELGKSLNNWVSFLDWRASGTGN